MLRRCQAPDCHLCHLLSLFTVLGGSGGQSRGLVTEGEGSALDHTACLWALGAWGEGGIKFLPGQD